MALLAALLGMNNNNNNNSGTGSNVHLSQQLQPLTGVGIVRGGRQLTTITPPPSSGAMGVGGTGGLGGIVHRAANARKQGVVRSFPLSRTLP